MKIERLELRHLRMPLVHFFETSFGRFTERDTVIVAAYSEGLVGYGEGVTTAAPFYSYETVETCWHIQRDFIAPFVLGRDLQDAATLMSILAPIRGHNMAKAGVEMACWDLWAQAQGVSVAALLGGTRERVPSGVSIGIQDSIEALRERIGAFLEEGYHRIKIKIKPGWDLETVEAVRRAFPEVPLMVDANSAYTLADADRLRGLDDYGLMMIEQPLAYDDIVDHARLQSQLKTPICLDESIHGPKDARQALDLGSCRLINIKAGRVGGLHQAQSIHDLCRQRDVPVWCGGRLESGIGRAHNIALASLPGFTLPGDISATARYYATDIVEPPVTLDPDGMVAVPQGPGLGVTIRQDILDRYTVRHEVLGGA